LENLKKRYGGREALARAGHTLDELAFEFDVAAAADAKLLKGSMEVRAPTIWGRTLGPQVRRPAGMGSLDEAFDICRVACLLAEL
jgi:hypothetical protein